MSTQPLTLTITTGSYYPAAERDRDHTSYFIAERVRTFENTDAAFDYLTGEKGLSPERAALVLNRRCEFQIDGDHDDDDLLFTVYKFARDAR